ncbi:hypothetical protein [Streptomyces chumphonensis]|uniref:hypothetical protein n=1 Tax=Streptomyces chumphonensis TaxID=1214925 RepID=UPI003D734ECE
MRHIDSADLALRALDGDAARLPAREAAHLRDCPSCARELASYRRVVQAGRTAEAADVPTPPPPSVWDAVLAGIEDDASGPDGPPP